MQIHQNFIYNTSSGKHIMQNTGYNNPRKEMRQIGNGLNHFFPIWLLISFNKIANAIAVTKVTNKIDNSHCQSIPDNNG